MKSAVHPVREGVGKSPVFVCHFKLAVGSLRAATGIDHYQGFQPEPELPSPDVEDQRDYEGFLPGGQTALFDSLAADVLSAAITVAKDVLIGVVNEPIFVADGQNHDVRYNGLYPRWAYDHYREFMVEWAPQRGLPWLDYWNALPRQDFVDANFHRRESGEERFARLPLTSSGSYAPEGSLNEWISSKLSLNN